MTDARPALPPPHPYDELADLSAEELEARCCDNFCRYCVKLLAGQARARREERRRALAAAAGDGH